MTTAVDPRGELKVVTLDGEPTWRLRCPSCGHWGIIDDDQAHGRVSVNHGPSGEQGIYEGNACSCGCTFHETRDWVETAVMLNAT